MLLKITPQSIPLYYVRGGNIDLNTGALRYAGHRSYYWANATYPGATSAYSLNFISTIVHPSDYNNGRFHGFSVEDVANSPACSWCGLVRLYYTDNILLVC